MWIINKQCGNHRHCSWRLLFGFNPASEVKVLSYFLFISFLVDEYNWEKMVEVRLITCDSFGVFCSLNMINNGAIFLFGRSHFCILLNDLKRKKNNKRGEIISLSMLSVSTITRVEKTESLGAVFYFKPWHFRSSWIRITKIFPCR